MKRLTLPIIKRTRGHQAYLVDIAYSSQKGAVSLLLCVKIVIILLLLTWMSVSLSSVFWRLMPSPEVDAGAVSLSSRAFEPQNAKASLPAVDIAALKAIPLFGKEIAPVVEVVDVAPEPVKENVEETRLNLTLVGSFANNIDEKRAYAIIANGRQQLLYRVDEVLEGLSNVKLLKVFSDRVILDNRGKQESLLMYPEGESLASSSVPASNLRLLEGDSEEGQVNEQSAARALASLNDNQRLQKISDAIRFTRKTENGKMIGFRVLPGRNRAAFEQTGLELNDIVTAIDGNALDNLKSANQIYREKRNATQASLTVKRGDDELSIDIDLDNINLN